MRPWRAHALRNCQYWTTAWLHCHHKKSCVKTTAANMTLDAARTALSQPATMHLGLAAPIQSSKLWQMWLAACKVGLARSASWWTSCHNYTAVSWKAASTNGSSCGCSQSSALTGIGTWRRYPLEASSSAYLQLRGAAVAFLCFDAHCFVTF